MRKIRYRLYEERKHMFIMALLLLTACRQNSIEETDNIAVAAPSENIRPLTDEEDSLQGIRHNITWEQIEVFPFSKALINNKVPLFTTRQRLETAVGKATALFLPMGKIFADRSLRKILIFSIKMDLLSNTIKIRWLVKNSFLQIAIH